MDLDDFTPLNTSLEIGQEHTEQIDESLEQQVLSGMDNILAEVAALHQTIKERLAYDHVKEEAFDRLYAEVEEVRQERSFQQLRPLLMDLILLYDRIEQGIQQMYELEGNSLGVIHLLTSFRDEVLEILYRRDVEMIVVGSIAFDRTLQQVMKLQPTALAEEHNQVARVVRRGFRYRNRILRSEEVIVYSYQANE
jgi:molecular chaperone GrpE